jgi:hypothetical protein
MFICVSLIVLLMHDLKFVEDMDSLMMDCVVVLTSQKIYMLYTNINSKFIHATYLKIINQLGT